MTAAASTTALKSARGAVLHAARDPDAAVDATAAPRRNNGTRAAPPARVTLPPTAHTARADAAARASMYAAECLYRSDMREAARTRARIRGARPGPPRRRPCRLAVQAQGGVASSMPEGAAHRPRAVSAPAPRGSAPCAGHARRLNPIPRPLRPPRATPGPSRDAAPACGPCTAASTRNVYPPAPSVAKLRCRRSSGPRAPAHPPAPSKPLPRQTRPALRGLPPRRATPRPPPPTMPRPVGAAAAVPALPSSPRCRPGPRSPPGGRR